MSQTILLGTPETRAELEDLQAKLADRRSTRNFAHAAVTMMLALISAGASGKLFWDARHLPGLTAAIGAAVIALGLATYAVTQYGFGRRHLRQELELFESLKSLRRTLRMDDPSALLPLTQ